MKHLKSLDALRGLALLSVVCFHTFYLPCGWVGVQVFFVLSGFLISGILLRLKETAGGWRPFLALFFWRRALRIGPLYFLYLGLFAVLLWKWPDILKPFIGESTAADFSFIERYYPFLLTFTTNFALPRHYALGHLWTLAVEGQFYLVWPFLVYFLNRRSLRILVVALALGGPLIRLGVFLYAQSALRADHIQGFIYDSTLSHLDAFASGALLTVLPVSLHDWLKRRAHILLLACVGLTLAAGAWMLIVTRAHTYNQILTLGYPITLIPETGQHIWGYSLLNCSSAALIFFLINTSRTPKLFNNPFLIYLGQISYGVYIYHVLFLFLMWRIWPDWRVHRFTPHSLLLFAAYLSGVIALSSVSYFGFEQPFLRLKNRLAPERKAALASTDA